MKFRLVLDDELDQIRNLDSVAGAIARKPRSLIEQLGKEFNQAESGGISGVEFTYIESTRAFGAVKTPFGIGRLRLTWMHDGKQLLGEVIVDREIFDKQDRQCWEPVYSFLLGELGGWQPSLKDQKMPYYLNRDPAIRYWALGASIVYAILNGPVIE
jgi:hypothetical protein